jgi:hypothetical protein
MREMTPEHKAKMRAAKLAAKGKDRPRTARMSPLQAIRAKCLDCCETREVVKYCTLDGLNSTRCPLWPFRFGRRPESVAKGPNARFVDPKQMPPADVPQEECGRYTGQEATSTVEHKE